MEHARRRRARHRPRGQRPRLAEAWRLSAPPSCGALHCIVGALALALQAEAHREAALITFLVTLSGVSLAGIGSAFCGAVAGALALFVQQWRPRAAARRHPAPSP